MGLTEIALARGEEALETTTWSAARPKAIIDELTEPTTQVGHSKERIETIFQQEYDQFYNNIATMSGRGGYGPVDNIDFDSLHPQHQKKLMEDVNLYENSQALGTSGRQQLLYQYANLSKSKSRNALGKMESPAQGPPAPVRMNGAADPTPPPPAQAPQQGRSAPPTFSSKLEQRWGRGEVMDMGEPLAPEEEYVEPTPQKPAKGGTFLNRIPADLLPFYKQLVPYYPYYSDYVPEDMVHVYRKLLPYFESTSNWKTSGLSGYWKGKEKRSIKMKDDYENLKRRDQEEDILLKIGQKMRELKMKQIEDNIQSQEILVEGLKKKYASMWTDEEGVEKKLDMGQKLAVETEPGKPEEEDPFLKLPTSMATYRNFEDVMDEKFRRLMGDFGDLTVERRRLAWGGKKLKSGDETEGMAGKGGFIGYSSGYRYRTRRAPRHGTIGYNVDSYYDVYVDDYFDEDIEPAPEVCAPVDAAPPVQAEQPLDPNLFAQDFIDYVPAIVDPVTTFKEEEFKHLEWDKDVGVFDNSYEPPVPPAAEPKAEPKAIAAPAIPAGEGFYVTVDADGKLIGADGAAFEILANGILRGANGAVFAATGVVLSMENALVNAAIAFEGKVALADGVKLEEGRKFVVKEQKEEEEEPVEPAAKPITIKGEVTLKDMKGDVFAEVHKDDAAGTVIGAESVIIIKNAKGKEVVRITRGYVTVKNFNVEEIVQIMRGIVSVKTMAGKEMVHVEKGEIYIEDFDGEVIVNNLADVNKLDEEMSLKNL